MGLNTGADSSVAALAGEYLDAVGCGEAAAAARALLPPTVKTANADGAHDAITVRFPDYRVEQFLTASSQPADFPAPDGKRHRRGPHPASGGTPARPLRGRIGHPFSAQHELSSRNPRVPPPRNARRSPTPLCSRRTYRASVGGANHNPKGSREMSNYVFAYGGGNGVAAEETERNAQYAGCGQAKRGEGSAKRP